MLAKLRLDMEIPSAVNLQETETLLLAVGMEFGNPVTNNPDAGADLQSVPYLNRRLQRHLNKQRVEIKVVIHALQTRTSSVYFFN